MPSQATMYYTADNSTRSNTAIVKLGSAGKISIYNYAGSVDVDLDVQGYFTTTSDAGSTGGFVPITPTRVANTITGDGVPLAQLAVGSSIDVQVSNGDQIPADATAVFANIEVNSTSSGNLRIGKGGQSAASVPPTVNYQDNGPTSSGVMLTLSTEGKIRVYNSAGGAVNFKVDIQGYFSGHSDEGGSFTALTPGPIYASTTSGNMALAGGETRTIQVSGFAGIPDDGTAGSAVLSVTAKNWTTNGTITVYDADDENIPEPTNLNFKTGLGDPGTGSTTTAIVELSAGGEIKIRNTSTARVDFYLSAQGWFSNPDLLPTSDREALTAAMGRAMGGTASTADIDLIVSYDMLDQVPSPDPAEITTTDELDDVGMQSEEISEASADDCDPLTETTCAIGTEPAPVTVVDSGGDRVGIAMVAMGGVPDCPSGETAKRYTKTMTKKNWSGTDTIFKWHHRVRYCIKDSKVTRWRSRSDWTTDENSYVQVRSGTNSYSSTFPRSSSWSFRKRKIQYCGPIVGCWATGSPWSTLTVTGTGGKTWKGHMS